MRTANIPTEPETLPKSDQNLIWLDCEMTGLEPETERILEIAVIVTGPRLEKRTEGPVLVVHQSDALLAGMDKWNQSTHGKSGLIDKVRASTLTEEQAQVVSLRFLEERSIAEVAQIIGKSEGAVKALQYRAVIALRRMMEGES